MPLHRVTSSAVPQTQPRALWGLHTHHSPAPASASPAAVQQNHSLLGGHAMARVSVPRDAGQSGNFDTRMKCAFERLMPTHHTDNWLSPF